MRKKLFAAAAAASLAGVIALGGIVVASPGSSAAPKHRTITVNDHKTNVKVLDLDHNGTFGPGDIQLFSSTEYDGRGHTVGFGTVSISVNFGHVMVEGSVTLSGRGQLVFAGADDLDPGTGKLAVVGGTGQFRNASGDLQFRSIDDKNTRLTFHLEP